jgi:hypothetical protein
MNNPMSRKLFQSREAREKLRGMGGIMASSPELAQTVAKFSDGMLVEGPNTAFLRQIRGVQNTTAEMQARTAIMQEQLRRREAARQAAAAKRFDIQALDPSFNLTTIPALDRFGEIEDAIAIAQLPEQGPVAPTAPVGSDGTARERTADAARILIENGMAPAEVQRMIDQGIDLNYLLAQLPPGTVPSIDAERPTEIPGAAAADFAEAEVARATGSRPMTTGTPLFEQSVELLPPGVEPPITEEVRPDRTGRAALLSQMEEEMRNRASQEEGAVAEERQLAATMEAEAEADDRESGAARLRLQAAQRAAAKVVTGGEGTGDGDGAPATAPAPFDFDASFEQALDRVGRVMGDAGAGDDEDSRKKAMANLAMIGLAIAAGQSPDALTNIAQGALSGMQAMTAQEARERDLERESRLTALEMTEKAADRASAERIAAIRGGRVGSIYADPQRTYAETRAAALATALAGDALDIMEGESPAEYADRVGREALQRWEATFKQSTGANVTVPTATVPTVATQADYDALPPGAEFIQNGQRRRKPE